MPPKNRSTYRPRLAPASILLAVLLGVTLALAGCSSLPFLESGTSTSPAAPAPAGGSVFLPAAGAAGSTPVLIQLTPAPAVAAPLTPLATLTIMNTPTPGPTPQSLARTENILVLGTDTRSNMTAWRTDSIMVVAIDRTAGQVGIMNIPRDLWVNVPTYGQERINAADYIGEKTHYPGGGPALVGKIVQNLFGVPTQHWVRIQQDGIIKLVDALGGVEVNLDCPLYEAVPDSHSPSGYRKFVLPAGKNFLDGPTAKEFVTFRYMTSGFGRERRQQQLIWAIRNRALRGDVLP
ncbi:MAG TPA: LCP family protein, partial [Anaerolineae bacterium]